MKKFNVLLFGISILAISFYGLSTNSYYIQVFMNLSEPFMYARSALVAVLLLYVFVPSFRLYTTKNLVGASGVLMLCLGLTSVASPTLLGYTDAYMLLGDSLILIEAGLLAIVLSAELSAQRSQFIMSAFAYIQSLFTNPLKDVLYTQIINSADPGTSLAKYLQNANTAGVVSKHLVKGNGVLSKT